MDEITKDVREGNVKEFLHADDLVLLEIVGKRFESECEKNEGFFTGEKTVAMEVSKFLCSVYRRIVRRNSILCIK